MDKKCHVEREKAMNVDRVITEFDKGLRTLLAPPTVFVPILMLIWLMHH